MKPHSRLNWLRVVLVLACFATTVTHAARKPQLRYQQTDSQTNLYRLEIEASGEGGTDILSGNIFVTRRPAGSNVIALAFRGSLTPRREPTPSRPGAYPTYGNYSRLSLISLMDGCEIQFDERGRVLRVSGDSPLPLPLGTVAQLFVEPLSPSDSRWEVTENLGALDESIPHGPAPSFLGLQNAPPVYYGNYSGRSGAGIVTVTRKTKFSIKKSTPEAITVEKKMSLESSLRAGTEPRLTASAEGEFTFDPELGLIRSLELQGKCAVNTEAVTRRMTTVLRLKLLEGKDREAALRPPTNTVATTSRPFISDPGFELERPTPAVQKPRKLTKEEALKLLDDIKSEDSSARMMALSKFQTSELAEAPAALLEYMSGAVTNTNVSLRSAAAKVVADYGTSEQVPVLLRMLKSSDHSTRYPAVRGLGRLKDKRAAEPLVALIATGYDSYQAVEALSKIGPDAEDAVLTMLKEKHQETRRQGCVILRQVGTKKSLDPLREMMLESDYALSSAASEAVRAIMARQ